MPHSGGGPGHYHAATAAARRVRWLFLRTPYIASLYFFLSFSLAHYFDLSLSKAIL